ncbi:MAG TPA: gliding motility-associated C-terminal domain-containing protein [Cytophagales bacterium]|nr:gliding motility-associated C-terminal domain-containing protein [Cytophagales bacterium]
MKWPIAILCIFIQHVVHAQNLVPNPGFEDKYTCPYSSSTWDAFGKMVKHWYSPNVNTPDYFHSCSNLDELSVPKNIRFWPCTNYLPAKEGEAYAGIIVLPKFKKTDKNHREYLQVRLVSPLKKDKKYSVSFYVALDQCSGHSFSQIGAYFSSNKDTNYIPFPDANCCDFKPAFKPQVYSDNVIDNKNEWREIKGTFIATGGEEWMSIGVFNDTLVSTHFDTLQYKDFPYFFIDDVSVEEAHAIQISDTVACMGDTVLLYTLSNSVAWSYSQTGLDTISTNDTLRIVLTGITKVFLHTTDTSYFITLYPYSRPSVLLPLDTFKCIHDTIAITALTIDTGYKYQWSTGDTAKVITVFNPGTYTITILNKGCKINKAVTVHDFPQPLLNLGVDTPNCFEDIPFVLLTAPLASKYMWQPNGETTNAIQVYAPGSYSVTITDTNNCIFNDSIIIDDACLYPAFIPNAFTPGKKDALNTIFKPEIINVHQFEMMIYNRWGELLFYTPDYSLGWNGDYKNVACAEGVYMYQIRFSQLINGKEKISNAVGTVSLIK